MGAKADIDDALNAISGAVTRMRLRLGASAARAFAADLVHSGRLIPGESLPKDYRGVPIQVLGPEKPGEEYFEGWELVGPGDDAG